MRSTGAMVAAFALPDASVPGVEPKDALGLSLAAADALAAALAGGARASSLVIHAEADTVRVLPRADLVAELQYAGVRNIARVLECMRVPDGRIVVFVDTEEMTRFGLAVVCDVLRQGAA